MNIELKEISKRYTEYWVLKKINYLLVSGRVYGVKGLNGSGKSTLMQILAGQLSPTLGEIVYRDKSGNLTSRSSVFSQISFSAPYISPLENLSLSEALSFHSKFRNFRNGIRPDDFIALLDYPFKKNQLIKYYSSGMKQRLSLALSILSESSLLLMDEPGSYLDANGKEWYHSLLKNYRGNTTTVISSNDGNDLVECSQFLEL